MTKTIVKLACLALLAGGAGCKKDKKGSKADKAEKADKTTEPVDKPPPADEKPKLDTIDDRVAFYRTCFDHLNAKDWDKFSKCYADDVVSENVGMATFKSRDEVMANIKMFAEAFPDLDATPTVVLASGNYVGSMSVFTGTNSGAMKMPGHEMPATNKKVGVEQWHMVEIDPAAGGAVKEWFIVDHATMMGQVGMSKEPHRDVMAKPTGEPTVIMAKGDDTEKANLATYQTVEVDAFNKHDLKAVMAGYAPTAKVIDHTNPTDMDAKGADKMLGGFFKGFPDIKVELVSSFAAGDYVVALEKVTGTNTGDLPMMKLKKTGKPVNLDVVEVMKFDKGKVLEHHIFMNAMSMAMQLGLMTPPGGEEKKPEETKPEEKKPAEAKPDMKGEKKEATP